MIKFGAFSMDQRKGARKKINGDPKRYSFEIELIGETATVQANEEDHQPICITTSSNEEELWILLMSKTPFEENYSAEQLFSTNGEEVSEIRTVMTHARGKNIWIRSDIDPRR